MIGWHFKPKAPGDTIRDPIHGEFFATDAISDPGMALIREGIQNSLDAARPGEVVTVRAFLSGQERAAPPDVFTRYFKGARPHLEAPNNGIRRDDVPNWSEPCPFLVFEDFGTHGLEGDPAEAFRAKTRGKNHFYHFFRAEGQTDKDSSQRGSWGVGKHVFWRSSRTSTVLAYTVRARDHLRFLMGKAVLKCHWVGNDYCQDGYYGVSRGDGSQFILPIDNGSTIEDFRSAFHLTRDREPGLSIIVPWPDEDVTHESLLRSVIHDYFYPILAGQLHVLVETPAIRTSLEKDSLVSEVRRIGGLLTEELEPLLELADWARSLPDDQKPSLQMPDPTKAWTWNRNLVPDKRIHDLQERFERLERIALRVPVTVREKGEPPKESYYDVFAVRDLKEAAGRPSFVREGVIIPNVDAPRSRGVRALVVADDGPIAAFLRDAENPSHTEWQHDGSNFRGKYRSGRADLTFVKRSVHEIVRILSETESKVDKILLADFFYLPAADAVHSRDQRPGGESGDKSPIPATPGQRPIPFRVQKIQGGFSILPGDKPLVRPCILEIRAAYDVRRGNPLKRYRTSDFRIEAAPIRFEPPPKGVEVLQFENNHLRVEVCDPDFHLHVAGFDPRRDLYVKIESREEILVDTTS
jgi:hypothetical protein